MVEKIERDTFLYLDHGVSPEDNFAQCGPCRMFVPGEAMGGGPDRCIIHGSRVKVGEGYSCGFMCGWPTGKPNPKVIADHAAELKKDIPGSVTPEESGLVDRPVRCENCEYFDDDESKCRFYGMLNKGFPAVFRLDDNVDEYSCCNANTAIGKQPGKGPSAAKAYTQANRT